MVLAARGSFAPRGPSQIAMARRTFDILRDCHGQEASVSGATQIRAGVQRPEIIVPVPEGQPIRELGRKEPR